MLALLCVYLFAKTWRLHERWLGYRSLAEAFRAGLFLAIAEGDRTEGDGDLDRASTQQTLETYGSRPESWHRRAFLEAWQRRPRPHPGHRQQSSSRGS